MIDRNLSAWLKQRWPTPDNEARRLFHGRGQAFPGLEQLTLDWYSPLLLITCHLPPQKDQTNTLLEQLDLAAPGQIKTAILQRRDLQPPRLEILRGERPRQPLAHEAGLSFPLLINQGVNHGFFLDMAKGRELLRTISREKKVLNLFAYTCSLSVAALAGEARQVVNLDMSKASLDLGKTAHQLNRQDMRKVSFLSHDLFKSFGKLAQLGPFDLLVVDPPAAQGKSFNAQKDWRRILQRLPGLLSPGGEIIACVSAPELGRSFLQEQFSNHLPKARLIEQLNAGDDFPEKDPDKGWHLLHYQLN